MTETPTTDLTLIREAILSVVDEGNKDGQVWMLDTEDEDRANQDRLDFCDAVQAYIVRELDRESLARR